MAFLVSLLYLHRFKMPARPDPRVVCHSTSWVTQEQRPWLLAVSRLTKHLRAGSREGF